MGGDTYIYIGSPKWTHIVLGALGPTCPSFRILDPQGEGVG